MQGSKARAKQLGDRGNVQCGRYREGSCWIGAAETKVVRAAERERGISYDKVGLSGI